jgi:collagen type I/II/III/V/XI/XXIV/XXVII alpha
MSKTITSVSAGITLTSSLDNPVSVTSTGAIISSTGSALYGQGGASNDWTIANSGLISSTGTGAAGIQLGSYTASNFTPVKAGTVTNQGTIAGDAFGISITGPGVVTNQSGGDIGATTGAGSYSSAVYIYGSAGNQTGAQVVNSGTLTGPSGIFEFLGGTVTNTADGYIGGQSGAGIWLDSAGTVANSGVVTAASKGAFLYSGGSITNAAGGTITGDNAGVYFGRSGFPSTGFQGTFDNAGTVSGSFAVDFAGSGGSYRLIAEPGAVFKGAIQGGQNVLELASGSSVGTLSGFGSTITNFSTLQVDNGADWRVAGDVGATLIDNQGTVEVGSSNTLGIGAPIGASSGTGVIEAGSGGTVSIASVTVDANQTFNFADNTGVLQLADPNRFQAPIYGFTIGNTIDLTSIPADAASWLNGTLTVTDSGTSVATLAMPGNFSGYTFGVLPNAGSTGSDLTVTAICYAAGTRILTPHGEVPIERLHHDDLVMTVSGRPQPIRWIGQRRVNFRRHPNRQRILPVRIAAHAFGEGRPKRNLLLSPDHAVYVEGVLIPIRHLINGTTITQIECRAITYYHIELQPHDVLLAEGMPAESYLEAGARSAFDNGDVVIQLHPQFTPQDHYAMLWEQHGYAPLVVTGEILERVRASLRAGSQRAA